MTIYSKSNVSHTTSLCTAEYVTNRSEDEDTFEAHSLPVPGVRVARPFVISFLIGFTIFISIIGPFILYPNYCIKYMEFNTLRSSSTVIYIIEYKCIVNIYVVVFYVY